MLVQLNNLSAFELSMTVQKFLKAKGLVEAKDVKARKCYFFNQGINNSVLYIGQILRKRINDFDFQGWKLYVDECKIETICDTIHEMRTYNFYKGNKDMYTEAIDIANGMYSLQTFLYELPKKKRLKRDFIKNDLGKIAKNALICNEYDLELYAKDERKITIGDILERKQRLIEAYEKKIQANIAHNKQYNGCVFLYKSGDEINVFCPQSPFERYDTCLIFKYDKKKFNSNIKISNEYPYSHDRPYIITDKKLCDEIINMIVEANVKYHKFVKKLLFHLG